MFCFFLELIDLVGEGEFTIKEFWNYIVLKEQNMTLSAALENHGSFAMSRHISCWNSDFRGYVLLVGLQITR